MNWRFNTGDEISLDIIEQSMVIVLKFTELDKVSRSKWTLLSVEINHNISQ